MGNVNEKNMARERMKSGSQDLFPGSPLKELKGAAFTFDKRPLSHESSQEDESNALSRSVPPGKTFRKFKYFNAKPRNLMKINDLVVSIKRYAVMHFFLYITTYIFYVV